MKLTRRCILRFLLCSPLAALGVRSRSSSAAQSPPMVKVPVCCAICNHYEPPRDRGLMLDGPPSGYCRHPDYRYGHYLCEEVISEFRLHRKPGDRCGRFSIRKDLSAGIICDIRQTISFDGETQ